MPLKGEIERQRRIHSDHVVDILCSSKFSLFNLYANFYSKFIPDVNLYLPVLRKSRFQEYKLRIHCFVKHVLACQKLNILEKGQLVKEEAAWPLAGRQDLSQRFCPLHSGSP